MSTLTIPNVFVNGTTIQSAPFNANFNAVAASVNSVDNTQIGPAGLFPNQLLPTTGAQATFGGSQPFGFGGVNAAATPGDLTIAESATVGQLFFGNGSAAQAATIIGQTNILKFVPQASLLPGNGAMQLSTTAATFYGTAGLTAAGQIAAGGTAATGTVSGDMTAAESATIGGLYLGNGTTAQTASIFSVTNTLIFSPSNASTVGQMRLSSAGALSVQPTINATNTAGYVPPVYTAAGAELAATTHIATGSVQTSTGSGPFTGTVTLSGAAVFTSNTSYVVAIGNTVGAGTGSPTISLISGTSFILTDNASSAAIYYWIAIGS